ncbi:MAG: TetR/AcrR family transcriptional regulator, partial [Bradyrhizobium sp.]
PRPPAMMMALHIWSMAHGVASLFSRGDAARRKLPMSPDELLEAEVLIYLRGLGFPTDRRQPPPVPPEASSGSGVPPGGPWGKPK